MIINITDHQTDIKFCLDTPADNQKIGNGFYISGWIIEKNDNISSIEIYISNKHIATFTKFYERPDVQSVYPDYHDSLHSGFKKDVNGVSEGQHELKIVATTNGKQYQILSKILDIMPLHSLNPVDFPKFIQIETINKCNLRCTMCPITIGESKRSDMSFELYEKIITECAKHIESIATIGLFLLDEPLLDPSLPQKISLAKKLGIPHVHIATNAELLTKEKILALFESGIDHIILSIESLSAPIQGKIRVGSHLERIMQNVDNLFELKKQHELTKPTIQVRMLAFNENRDEWKKFSNHWLEKGAESCARTELHNWGGKFKEIHPELVGINVCNYLWNTIVIQSDGNVCLCCLDASGEYKLGNVKNQSIYEIWHGEKFKEVRKQFLDKKLSKCIQCNWTPGNQINVTEVQH